MGWNNPPISWREYEARLSGKVGPDEPLGAEWAGRDQPRVRATSESEPDEAAPLDRNGDPVPPWSRRRAATVAGPATPSTTPVVPYAELHCHSNFSFLDGASDPEALIAEAVSLGLSALAITDHDGLYAVARFAESAQNLTRAGAAAPGVELQTIYGAELSLGLRTPQNGVADPEGSHLLVLARGVEGYHQLAKAITDAQLDGDEKGRPLYDLDQLAATAEGHWTILTGCRKGAVRQALAAGGPSAAAADLDRLTALFGHDRVVVELFDHGRPDDSTINDQLVELARVHELPVVATNAVHYAQPKNYRLATAMAAVRARRSLAEMDGWLPVPGAHLRSGEEMTQIFARYPGVIEQTLAVAADCAFDLKLAKPRLPKLEVPDGHTPASYLRQLCWEGFEELYPGGDRAKAAERLERELTVIEGKDFPGYFLIVHDMVAFARARGILCQGRGSAANSVVCYVLKITAVDPVLYDLPFERFLSAARDEEPDIDVDFDSDRREEVIQEVYRRYRRDKVAQVANVISYRPKSAVRDMAKALGYSTGQQDAWSKQIDSWGRIPPRDEQTHDIPEPVTELANQLLGAPRHLGIHACGMVLTERPVGEVVPIERGRMDARTVLQWDKDSCAYMGLVKFDFLGLGILSAMQYTFDLIAERVGESWTLQSIPKEEPGVYDMLCRADSIGVFQIESRAQIGTLPRLQPRKFYDLVIEIALIRPGPIQGGAVHPYIRRATGRDEAMPPHPALEPVLKRTLGVPLFQEQLMQIATEVGGCTGEEADLLRRAMGSKRGIEKIERIKDKLYDGMKENGIVGEVADGIYARIQAFASFGFAESHAISFALLVYASSWLKLHYPGAFLAGLLRAQPMGFYSPQSLVADARRHGVEVRRPDIALSGIDADLEPLVAGETMIPGGMSSCLDRDQPEVGKFNRSAPDLSAEHRRDGSTAVRLGLTSVTSIGRAVAERILAERERQSYADINDVVRRAGLTVAQTEALATAGAFDSFGLSRRQALWNAGYADSADTLPGTAIDAAPPELPGMSDVELTVADLWATKISPGEHPVSHLRDALDGLGIRQVGTLGEADDTCRVRVAGLVTHRQRPGTAGGVTFLNLEDETGMLNIVCSAPMWNRYRRVGRQSNALVIRGRVEHADGVTNLVAERFDPLALVLPTARALGQHRSRDFH
ncbi:error-prone DNA polymerase [Microlunatus phosphovorus]|uniref:error-prone DNA polymerase n=1 Tax=Microlunatus phosphovorus TaxID=29405 RepID=UPI0005A04F80|nr:error-prone DNA polymerase [Microlunatus phosphovorus]